VLRHCKVPGQLLHLSHTERKEQGANTLAQCASGYEVTTGMFIVKEKPTSYNYESVNGEFCLGSGEVGNGPASHDPKYGASAAEMPQDMHAGTRPTLPVAKSSQASKGESNRKEIFPSA
jgi:hypothetical protein